jgi:hypothetical protein
MNLSAEVQELGSLIGRLIKEHREFSTQTCDLGEGIEKSETFDRLEEIFIPLNEQLVDHMLVEETEIFPEVSRRGLFDERVSEIMQQHLDITAALDEMKFALHRKNLEDLESGFTELTNVMKLHFPAEEKEVFSLVTPE